MYPESPESPESVYGGPVELAVGAEKVVE